MADYAPNYTARYRVRYSALGAVHTMQVRLARGTTDPTPAANKVTSLLNILTVIRSLDWRVLGAEFAPADSDVFLPAPVPTPNGGIGGSDNLTAAARAASLSWVGRSTAGGRAVVYLYGTILQPDSVSQRNANFRITRNEDDGVGQFAVGLSEIAPAFVANDNFPATFYAYANIKYNDHWVKKLRTG